MRKVSMFLFWGYFYLLVVKVLMQNLNQQKNICFKRIILTRILLTCSVWIPIGILTMLETLS